MSDTPEQDALEADAALLSAGRRLRVEREAHVQTKRELKVLRRAHAGTLALQRITIAGLRYDKARLRSEWASCEADHATLVLLIKKWESRTGLDHSEVLQGVYGNPLGNAG